MINFFWGVMFILLGSLFFLANFDIVSVDWGIIFSLWPFLIILIGVYFLPGKVRVIGTLSLTILLTGVMIYAVQWGRLIDQIQVAESSSAPATKPDPDFNFDATTATIGTNLEQEFAHAELNLTTTNGLYQLEAIGQQLFNLQSDGQPWQVFNLDEGKRGDTGIVSLNLAGISATDPQGSMKLGLHKKPLWQLTLTMDTTKAVLDLTPFRISNLRLQAPASDLQLKLGNRHADQQIRIDGDGSEVRIQLPAEAGSEVQFADGRPVDFKMSGLKQTDQSGTYRTNNYPMADKQIEVVLISKPERLVINRTS